MISKRLSPSLICGILLIIFIGIALYIRIYLPYDRIFTADWVKFSSSDAYFHMRLVDIFVNNFPLSSIDFDPYLVFPGGGTIGAFQFFEVLMSAIIWVIGLGSPTQHTIDVVGALFPAILGALTIIPVYFIGKELFGRWIGIISAGIIMLIPGEFVGRSTLGFTDGDIISTLLITLSILFLILAVKTARKREWTFNDLKNREGKSNTKIIIYSLTSGLFLGAFMSSWQGALLLVFIISAFFIIQFIIDHMKHNSTDYLCFVGVISFLVTILTILIVSPQIMSLSSYLASLIIAILIPPMLFIISRLMTGKGIRTGYYPLLLAGCAVAGLAIFYVINPSLVKSMLGLFNMFNPAGYSALTTIEMQPILFPRGDFTTSIIWGNFTTTFYMGIISILLLIFVAIKQGNAEKNLLVIWSLIMLVATIGQRRFAIHFAVNAALLSGYFTMLLYPVIRSIIDYFRGKSVNYMSWKILEANNLEEVVARPVELSTRAEKKEKKRIQRKEEKKAQHGRTSRERPSDFHYTIVHGSLSLWLIAIFFLSYFPNIGLATDTAGAAPYIPNDAWCSSLSWLKENSPEPFDNPDYYFEFHDIPPGSIKDRLPESAYGVTAWWDYGYWISRIAHRIPNANPGQNPKHLTRVAKFFTAQDERAANRLREEMDSSYVVIDDATSMSKFWAIATWSGRKEEEYIGIFYGQQNNELIPYQLFLPEYYRSLSSRLYNFNGEAVTPTKTIVISYQEVESQEGTKFKLITEIQQFDKYEEAEAYLMEYGSENQTIVNDNPLESPIPLEALKNYQLVYSSNMTSTLQHYTDVPAVKIFKYVGD